MTTIAIFRSLTLCTEAEWYWLASHRLRGRVVRSAKGRPLSEWLALSVMRSLARTGDERVRVMAQRNLASIGMLETREGAA